MIEVLPESKGNILVLGAEGTLTDQDYKNVLIPRLESIIREHGKARLLMEIDDDFHGWKASALWDDMRLGFMHRKDFEKIAILGGPRWIGWGLKLGGLIVRGEIKKFQPDERGKALRWIKA